MNDRSSGISSSGSSQVRPAKIGSVRPPSLGLGLVLAEGDTLALLELDGLTDADGDTEGLALEDGETDALGDSLADAELDGLVEALGLTDALGDGETDADGLTLALGETASAMIVKNAMKE